MIIIFYVLPKYALGSYTFKFNVLLVCIHCRRAIVVYFRRSAPPSCLFRVANKIASTPLQVVSSAGKVHPDISYGSFSKADVSRHRETNQN